MKIKSRQCRSLREFTKINRKYARHAFRKGMWVWYVWLTYDIIGLDALNDPYFMRVCSRDNNLRIIRDEVIANYGRTPAMADRDFDVLGINMIPDYRLVGVSITNEDYYYILQDDNGHTQYFSCVGGLNDMIAC